MSTIVVTKKELKEAINRGDESIIVRGNLAKRLKQLEKISKLTPGKIASLIAFAGGSGAAIIAATALAPETAGISMLLAATPVVGFSVLEGIQIALVAGFVLMCALFGTQSIIAMLKGYKKFKFRAKGFGQEYEFEMEK